MTSVRKIAAKQDNVQLLKESSFESQLKSFMGSVSLAGVHWIIDCHYWAAKQLWVLVLLSALSLTGIMLQSKKYLSFFMFLL